MEQMLRDVPQQRDVPLPLFLMALSRRAGEGGPPACVAAWPCTFCYEQIPQKAKPKPSTVPLPLFLMALSAGRARQEVRFQ